MLREYVKNQKINKNNKLIQHFGDKKYKGSIYRMWKFSLLFYQLITGKANSFYLI